MGYPNFNLTTIQLPAPSSNMTKAEYKAAYGIDLDAVNIKSFKLVLFGNDKYAIDQIKEIVGGYEVYFNGRILSITDTIETSGEVYDVANSKPIYCHPVTLENHVADAKFYLAMLIFNNDSTPFTKPTLSAFLKSIPTALFVTTGSYSTATFSMSPSGIYVKDAAGYPLSLIGYDSLGVRHSSGENTIDVDAMIALTSTNIGDGVNKIN